MENVTWKFSRAVTELEEAWVTEEILPSINKDLGKFRNTKALTVIVSINGQLRLVGERKSQLVGIGEFLQGNKLVETVIYRDNGLDIVLQ